MIRQHNKASEFPLTPAQIQAIINANVKTTTKRSGALILRDRVLLKTLAYLAVRCGEAAQMDWRDFDLSQGNVTIQFKGARRVLPFGKLYPDLLSDLMILKGNQYSGPVFQNSRRSGGLTTRRIAAIVKAKAQAAGITSPNPNRSSVHPHMFRHSWAQNAIAAGVTIAAVQKWLGHAKAEITINHYGQLSQGMLTSELMGKLRPTP